MYFAIREHLSRDDAEPSVRSPDHYGLKAAYTTTHDWGNFHRVSITIPDYEIMLQSMVINGRYNELIELAGIISQAASSIPKDKR